MLFGSIVSSPRGSLSPQQALDLANVYLENAYQANDSDIALVLCHDTEVSLSQAKKAVKHAGNPVVIKGIGTAYIDLGKLLESHGHVGGAQASYKKGEKLGGNVHGPTRPSKTPRPRTIEQPLKDSSHSASSSQALGSVVPSPLGQHKQRRDVATVPAHVFPENLRPLSIKLKLPEADERLNNTLQLVCCLGLIQDYRSTDDILEPVARKWLQATEKDTDEQERLHSMATEVIRAFKRDEIKDAKAVAEVVYLAPVLNKDAFQDLLREFYSGIDHSGLLNFQQLEGLAQLIQGADPGHLSSDDLVKILELLSTRLRDTHKQSTQHMHQLTLAVSHVLDAMADTKVTNLDREKLHEPLSNYLTGLKGSSDPFLVYQAAYAFQALLCVPDNETTWQAAMRRTGKVIQGVSGLVSAVKGLDLNKFIEGLGTIQQGIAGVAEIVGVVKTAYEGVSSLAEGGQGFLKGLKEGLSFERKRDWYSALRGADTLIRDGELATFRKLVCEAPCRYDAAFQWGVCQRLGEIAANPMWDPVTRRSAIAFLGEIYQNDLVWGQQASVKQWILNTLMLMASSSGSAEGSLQLHVVVAETLLQELGTCEDAKKLALYQTCRANDPIAYPMKVTLPDLASPSLLDRVQNRPDVEASIRLLRKQRTKERGHAVYIPPQAKTSLQAADGAGFPLMEKVMKSLESDQKVFLLLGDSGAGKSTFSRELEFELWQMYTNKTGRIPLHINLPTIDKCEHDLIAKQLRKVEFTEPQIREMKHHRKFILICDGYDESQQTHNLYTSNRLNLPGEWDAQMVISCRNEYLGADYRDRFQPGDRNQLSDSSLFQEAVISPFTTDQVQTYIQQYVSVNQPLWRVEDYKQALELIPSLKDLVKNPFLMALSLEVLPRMVDPGEHLSTTRVTRVALYDHFVEQWLERGKKRLGEKDMSQQTKAAFERLSAEGFTRNGVEYLKRLAAAIYKEQGGHPVIEYSQLMDEGSWKDAFFEKEHKQLLLEACPLTRNGNQHRFIHRSLLEYGLASAIFDPQDRRNKEASEPTMVRRGSASSTLSFEIPHIGEEAVSNDERGPDLNSPLAWRSFVNDYSLIQFLEERVQLEPAFKKQLLAYIEYSKTDKQWRTAAANAITILVRAGVQFVDMDLQGIQIPGADLSYGVFDSVKLQDADLRKVNLRGAWLRHTDLSRTLMTGVQFGELPYVTEVCTVESCVYSPDGRSFAAGLENGDISVYATSDWEKLRTLDGHSKVVQSVVYSPKGDQLASGSQDMTVWLWDAETGSCQHIFIGHTDEVTKVAYSPQGNQLASASDDKTVKLWDLVTGDCLQTLSGHNESVLNVVYSPRGNQIASGSEDHTIRLWSVENWTCGHILTGHSDEVWDIAYSPQGDQLASGSFDKTIRLWDVETGTCRHVLAGHSYEVNSVAYSPKGDQLASGGQDATVRIWDVETGTCRHILAGHSEGVFCAIYSPKGSQVASGSEDMTVRLWDVSSGASRYISSGHIKDVPGVEFSPKGDHIASGSNDSTIRLWDAETGACRRILTGHEDSIFCIAYSPRGDLIASGGMDSVRLWDVETGTCRHNLTGHTDSVNGIAFSLQGDVLASVGEDKVVRLWDVETGNCRSSLDGHTEEIFSIMYSPDGKRFATGSMDSTIRLWNVETALCDQILKGHDDWIQAVVFSPQGQQLASASEDDTVRIWNLETGDCRLTLTGHKDGVLGIAYSLNGKLLASGSEDKTVRLWDVASGQCRATISDLPGYVAGLAWATASDTNYLVTGCADGSMLKWQVVEEADQCSVHLQWGKMGGTLNVSGASIQDMHGLSQLNRQLLKQRGAKGEPEYLLREASKKLFTMASVLSKLKQRPAIDSSPDADHSNSKAEQQGSEQQGEQQKEQQKEQQSEQKDEESERKNEEQGEQQGVAKSEQQGEQKNESEEQQGEQKDEQQGEEQSEHEDGQSEQEDEQSEQKSEQKDEQRGEQKDEQQSGQKDDL